MYGIVNQAIQGLVQENFGNESWQAIKKLTGIENEYFLSNESYEDDITYELVAVASEVLQLSTTEILRSFGEYWILKTGYERYGDLMKAGGANLFDFICNLPNFHGRIMLIYPNLSPPEFVVEKIGNDELKLHYYSSRQGLTEFVFGLLQGLSKMFNEPVEIVYDGGEHKDVWHDVFKIKF